MTGNEALDAEIAAILDRIHDPCSVAAGRPTSVRAMGLVLGWTLDAEATLTVRFAVTFAGCTMAPHFTEAARVALEALPGIGRVATIVDVDHVWDPASLGPRRPMVGKPQAWRDRVATA